MANGCYAYRSLELGHSYFSFLASPKGVIVALWRNKIPSFCGRSYGVLSRYTLIYTSYSEHKLRPNFLALIQHYANGRIRNDFCASGEVIYLHPLLLYRSNQFTRASFGMLTYDILFRRHLSSAAHFAALRCGRSASQPRSENRNLAWEEYIFFWRNVCPAGSEFYADIKCLRTSHCYPWPQSTAFIYIVFPVLQQVQQLPMNFSTVFN